MRDLTEEEVRQKQYREQIRMTDASLTNSFIDLTSESSGKVPFSSLYLQHVVPVFGS